MIVRPLVSMGAEHVPLQIIDDAHPAPDALRRTALDRDFRRLPGDFYPGLRADIPDDYADWLSGALNDLGSFGHVTTMRASFAVATDDPATLAPIQRIPHFDTPDPGVFAAIHYLCDPPHGGTSFYRHRRTGYQRINAERQPAWRQALVQDGKVHGLPPARYMADSDERFERIGTADLRFNRLILYPANCLHAGNLAQGWREEAGMATARLTVTSLLSMPGMVA